MSATTLQRRAGKRPARPRTAEPAQPEQPEQAAQPAPEPEPSQQAQPVPGPSAQQAGETRLCSFCNTRQPLAQLHMQADSLQCADVTACLGRARSSGIYSQAESELAVSARELHQGAIRYPAQPVPQVTP